MIMFPTGGRESLDLKVWRDRGTPDKHKDSSSRALLNHPSLHLLLHYLAAGSRFLGHS